jgi:hypothetical protein
MGASCGASSAGSEMRADGGFAIETAWDTQEAAISDGIQRMSVRTTAG